MTRQRLNRNRVIRREILETRRLLAGDAPSFSALGDQIVEVGAPLHLPIDGFDPNGGPLTVTVQVSNPDAVVAEVITGNRSLRLDVANFGTMVFELYEGRAPRPAGRVIELAESGFYNGIIFHRVIDNFVLQAGDPNGTGQTGSELGTFDDQFHPDLQHNQKGLLSFAKTSFDDTNNSQFFVTERATRNLDYHHSVFGQMVEGEDVREAISSVATDPDNDKPLTDVVISSATIFEDIENSVVMFRAVGAGVQSDVTMTITDEDGNSFFETFSVNTIADQFDAQPYLAPIPPVFLSAVNQNFSLQLLAHDNENDDVRFFGQFIGNTFDGSGSLDSASGLLELEPADGFVGDVNLIVGVEWIFNNTSDPDRPLDTQQFQVRFVDSLDAPSLIDLLATSDTGQHDDDNITAADSFVVQVGGVTPGADVEIVRQGTGLLLGIAKATGTTVDVNVDLPNDLFGADELDGMLELIARQRTGDLISDAGDTMTLKIDRTAPQITSDSIPEHLFAGSELSASLTADETSVQWTLVSGPTEISIDQETGDITWATSSELRGLQTFTVGVQDAAGNSSEASFSMNVTSKYHNVVDAFDVDGLGSVTSLDALLIINAISRNGKEIQLPETDGSQTQSSTLRQDFFYNANNDTAITALDALVVINEIARRKASSGGGDNEFVVPIAAPPLQPRMRGVDDDHLDRGRLF